MKSEKKKTKEKENLPTNVLTISFLSMKVYLLDLSQFYHPGDSDIKESFKSIAHFMTPLH